jgi:hypothetical protein
MAMALPRNAHDLHADAPRMPESFAPPGQEIARLALLHDEARETALLANLLGRTPYAAAALAVGALASAILARGTMPIAEPAAWLVLTLIGVGAMARSYARAIRQPFERGTLREFSYDLNAIAIYAGFAWGAGAFLVLGPQTSLPALTLFAAAIPLVVAVTLRTREISLGFLAPVAALSAFAAVLRPLPEGPLAAAFVLIACMAVGSAIFWADRSFLPVRPGARRSEAFHA